MQYRTIQPFLPLSWILVILTVLCCGMFWQQEPVVLGALSRDASAPSSLKARDGLQEMPVLLLSKWQEQVLYPAEKINKIQSQYTPFITYSPSPRPEASPVTLFPKKFFSQSLPALWHGFGLCSRSPPSA